MEPRYNEGPRDLFAINMRFCYYQGSFLYILLLPGWRKSLLYRGLVTWVRYIYTYKSLFWLTVLELLTKSFILLLNFNLFCFIHNRLSKTMREQWYFDWEDCYLRKDLVSYHFFLAACNFIFHTWNFSRHISSLPLM